MVESPIPVGLILLKHSNESSSNQSEDNFTLHTYHTVVNREVNGTFQKSTGKTTVTVHVAERVEGYWGKVEVIMLRMIAIPATFTILYLIFKLR